MAGRDGGGALVPISSEGGEALFFQVRAAVERLREPASVNDLSRHGLGIVHHPDEREWLRGGEDT